MEIKIQYCSVWNYKPRAAGLAEELQNEFSATVTLDAGSNGVFDVSIDGEMVFSKFNAGRFPEPGEIGRLFRNE